MQNAIGWRLIDGKYYYFSDNGYMLHDTYIDGYKLGSDGAWVVSTPRILTTTNYVVNEVNLWPEDDGSGRQIWDIQNKIIEGNGDKKVLYIAVRYLEKL